MSTKFYFKSVQIDNFRSFQRLDLQGLRRINIIGGYNGVGKTALLESMFFFMDRRDPLALLKPLSWRRIDSTGPLDTAQFFHDYEIDQAHISCDLRTGTDVYKLQHRLPPTDVSLSIASTQLPAGVGTTDTSQKGISFELSDSRNRVAEQSFLLPAANGAIGNVSKISETTLPNAQILSIATRTVAQELANRFSILVRQRRTPELIAALRTLVPDLQGLQTLQIGPNPQIFAEVDAGLLPIQLLGDGFQNLFQTILAIITCKDGVVFLDEIDAALHYSKVAAAWNLIARLADAENCQIFATTHSRECINSAADGIKTAGREKDFQYIRLQKDKNGDHIATPYNTNEVKNAEISDIEIR